MNDKEKLKLIEERLEYIINIRLKSYEDVQYGKKELKELLKIVKYNSNRGIKLYTTEAKHKGLSIVSELYYKLHEKLFWLNCPYTNYKNSFIYNKIELDIKEKIFDKLCNSTKPLSDRELLDVIEGRKII